MKSLFFNYIKSFLHFILDYSIYVIYQYDLAENINSLNNDYEFRIISQHDLAKCDNQLISKNAWYAGEGSHTFACFKDKNIISICVYWYGERYKKNRNFWPLQNHEAKLVQLFTLPKNRGQGIASMLISYSSKMMVKQKFKNLFSRVWHSNLPSRKAFEKNNWNAIATVIEINPIKKFKPFRYCITRRIKN